MSFYHSKAHNFACGNILYLLHHEGGWLGLQKDSLELNDVIGVVFEKLQTLFALEPFRKVKLAVWMCVWLGRGIISQIKDMF